jgi:crotonobetainyl-CoA:carnitine CoA-transferase CaiB-like acyl-CoA transferase
MLQGLRALDLADERGLLCGQILADLGADVIAVEPPGGSTARRVGPFANGRTDPEQSLYWWSYARNKRGITLDLESEDGREQLRGLAATADLLIESFEPGYLDRAGLGYEALAQLNPGLIMVSITPFGQNGPKARWAATDLTVWAASGSHLITGDADRAPVQVSVPQAFLHAGAEAAAGSLIALAGRERSGRGDHVDVSAQAAAAMATQSYILSHGWGDTQLTRVAGGAKAGPLHLRFIYPCSDGYVSILFLFGSAIGPFTRRLFEWMYEDGVVDETMRDKDWLNYTVLLMSGQEPLDELLRCTQAIERFTRRHTKAELFGGALRRGLLLVPVATTADVLQSEQLAARDYWQGIEQPQLGRMLTYPGPFAKLSATPIEYRRRAPRIGEHNAEILDADVAGRVPGVGEGTGVVPALPPASGREGRGESGSMPDTRPLGGLKVVDFSWVMAGPMGVRYLADYGATVVHVESTTRIDTARTIGPWKDQQPGAERSTLYANVNANKLGLALNLGKPEAREVAKRLIAWADVVVEGYSPKAMRNWGMSYGELRALNPGLIMLSTCLNGQTGPHAALAGFGTMGSALAGFVELAGWPDRAPAGPMGAYTDYIVPKLEAAVILAALDHRRRTGEGQYIDFSQAEAGIHFLAPAILDYAVNGRVAGRNGNASPDFAPHGVYPAEGADRWVAIAVTTEQQWRALCTAADHRDWMSDARFASNAARLKHADALDREITAWSSCREVDAIEQELQAAGVPVHRLASSADAFADPQLAFRGHFVTVENPILGPVPVETSRIRFGRTPAHVSRPGPVYGQDNEHVLRDILGLSDGEITELVVAGALE